MTGRVIDGLRVSENNCLVLTITAPADASDAPVLVWFHGGAYMAGTGETAKYDAGHLVRHGGVVVVTVSYRLGIFGYLNLDSEVENLGLRDQLLALRWVSENIGAFGGDRNNVTIAGQSAGGDAVYSLLLCEDADGLIHRAILQSAPLGLLEGRAEMIDAMRSAAADSLQGVSPTTAPQDDLLQSQVAAVSAASQFRRVGGFPFAPVLGRAPLPSADNVTDRIAQVAESVDLLVGYTKDDGEPFAVMAQRSSPTDESRAPAAQLHYASAALTDAVFAQPALTLARTWRSHRGRAATFRVDWSPDDAPLGACHCIELPLLFDAPGWADAPMLGPHHDPIDHDLASELRTCWAMFAHGGVDALRSASLTFG